MESREPVRRTSEIEELTNLYLIHPMASRLATMLAAVHVHPNIVSIAGMACGILSGVAYYRYRELDFALAGLFLMILWHVLDGTDGQLARLTNSQSEFGKVLDGVCDYVTFIAVYSGLALALSRQHGDWIWGVVIASGACHAIQSAAYEMQRQDYNFWGWGRGSAGTNWQAASHRVTTASRWQKVADRLLGLYSRMQVLAAGIDSQSRQVLAATLRLRPEGVTAIRGLYREIFAPALRHWSILSANYRTLGIFLFSFFKIPLYYFYLEIFGLSAILLVLLSRQPALYRRLFTRLDTVE